VPPPRRHPAVRAAGAARGVARAASQSLSYDAATPRYSLGVAVLPRMRLRTPAAGVGHTIAPQLNHSRRRGTVVTLRVGINGFGRTGRQFFRAWWENHRDSFDIVAINGRTPVEMHTHLLRYDSDYGRFPAKIEDG